MSRNNFESWYYNANGKKNAVTQAPSEALFFDVVGVKIHSLASFISWLTLNKHIPNTVKNGNKKPVALISLPLEQKISTLVKNVRNLKDLANEFNKVFGDIVNKKVD